MDKNFKKMLAKAKKARANAYAPYSKFKVGVCIYTKNKKYFVGANSENSSFPEGTCAETNAIGAMISAGERYIQTIVMIGTKHKITSPCGGCRQRIAEFSSKNTKIYLCDDDGDVKEMTLAELLPESFSLDA